MANKLRNYCLTINNPYSFSTPTTEEIEKILIEEISLDSKESADKGEYNFLLEDIDLCHNLFSYHNDQELFDYCKNLKDIKYFVFQREKGDEKQTEHIQMYLEFAFGKYFSTIKSLFPKAHIEERKGSKTQARKYCMKEDTRLGEVYEFGDFVESGERSDLTDAFAMIQNGATDFEIYSAYPNLIRCPKLLDTYRQKYLEETYRKQFRNVKVYYIYGDSGIGKSRYVSDKFGYDKIYRVTQYGKNYFDDYQGEKIIVFEEFRSQIKISEMLNYLDGHPCYLPCRFNNKIACYDTVFILSNWNFTRQYELEQRDEKKTYDAFKRRITETGTIKDGVYVLDNNKDLFVLSEEEIGELPF